MPGINAADAICGALLGKRSAGGDHAEAVDLLRQAGADGKAAATQLTRLIPLKSQAEYDPSPVSRKRAESAVPDPEITEHARTLDQESDETPTLGR